MLYAGDDGFLAGTVPFVVDGLDGGEPVMVAVEARKIELLRAELGDLADDVSFVDMGSIGGNPACIIPAWQEFVGANGGGPARGVGEPIGPDRHRAALLECQRHEVLLNTAFDGGPAWWLVCPYDTTALGPAVIDEAVRSHPFVLEDGASRTSASFAEGNPAAFDEPLPEPAHVSGQLDFGFGPLDGVRRFVAHHALALGLGGQPLSDLLVAVNELATNSLCHGGGSGRIRVWQEPGEVVCEVSDGGVIDEPLVGRRQPGRRGEGGRGLWIVNHLCDLVELRSTPAGTTVRLHVHL